MRRLFVLLMSMFLGAASVATVAAIYSLAPASDSRAPTGSGDIEVARRYYDAVNHMIATGDPVLLREVVSSAMVDIEPAPPGFAGRDGIERYLGFLHAAAPDARIEPTSTAQHRGQVTVHVSVQRETSSTLLGFVLNDRLPLWQEVEALRVAQGQIVEREASWDGMAILAPDTGFPFELDVPARRELIATLDTYAPSTVGRFATIDAPEILRLLDGELEIALSESATEPAIHLALTSNGEMAEQHAIPPGHAILLAPGDVVVIPPGSAYIITNHLGSTASVMRVSASIPPVDGAVAESLAQPLRQGIFVQTLERLQPGELGDPAQISLGSVTLMPGGRLATTPETKLLIACSEIGTLRCVDYESGSERDGMVRVYQFLDRADTVTPMLVITRESDREVLVNAGSEAASAWIIAVTITEKNRR